MGNKCCEKKEVVSKQGKKGDKGDKGSPGPKGTNGLFGGFSDIWKFDTAIIPGPASTFLRLNNASMALVTAIYVNDTDKNSIDADAFLDSLDNSGSFGFIRIFKEFDSTIYWEGRITSVSDSGTYHILVVEYISHNGSFSANDAIVVSFAPAGASSAIGFSADITDNFNLTLTVAPSGGTAPYTYLWTIEGQGSDLGTNQFAITAGSATATVTYSVAAAGYKSALFRARITDANSNVVDAYYLKVSAAS